MKIMRGHRRFAAWSIGISLVGIVAIGVAQRGNEGATQPSAEAFEPTKHRFVAGSAEGKAKLTPSDLQAGEVGEYKLIVTVGAGGIAPGGGLLVAHPKSWFTNPFPLWKTLQQETPEKPHYAGVASSREGSKLTMTIDQVNLVGKTERFARTMTIRVEGEALREGDEIAVALANTTSPYLAGQDEIEVAIDAKGDGQFRKIKKGATYEVFAGAGEEMVLVGPSQAVVGKEVKLVLTAFDRFQNRADVFAGPVTMKGIDGVPPGLEFGSLDRSQITIPWTPTKEGFYWPEATATIFINQMGSFRAQRFVAPGNPIRVFAEEPKEKIYWGDLHSHSEISKDGVGKDDYVYARELTRLDFFASTEHSDDDGRPLADGITPAEWEEIKSKVRDQYQPGEFVTLLGYECSLGAPSGHHNVIYRSIEGLPWMSRKMKDEHGLWAKLKAGEAITIPHHLGIAWGAKLPPDQITGPELQKVSAPTSHGGGPAVDWGRPDNPDLRPLLEIYSLHGNSEYFDKEDPLAYENAGFTFSASLEGKHYARDAWEVGRYLGVAAASDNHTAQPGQRQGGLTAARAPELTREAVFDALKSRFTYATTGERIYMDFQMAGVRMGQRANKFSKDSLPVTVTVATATPIEYVEILAIDWSSGQYRPVKRWEKPGKLVDETFEMPNNPFGAMYYVRCELTDKVRNRPVRAWSSPIWVDP
jgi:hypothetical protein